MVLLRLLSIAALALLLRSTITGATEVDHPTGQKDVAAHPTRIVVDREDDSSILKHTQTFQERLLSVEQVVLVEPPVNIDFYEISIVFSEPDAGAGDDSLLGGKCNEAERILMDRDINLLLLDYGIGDLGDDADPSYLAGICPLPQAIGGNPELEQGLPGRGPRYVWRGGGGCRMCGNDDKDYSYADPGGTEDTPRPTPLSVGEDDPVEEDDPVVETLAEKVKRDIEILLVPKYPSCLSDTTTIDVTFTEVTSSEIDVYCGREEEQFPLLETMGYMAWEDNTIMGSGRGVDNIAACGPCRKLDFSTKGDGKTKFKKQGAFLKKKEYWKDSPYGVRICTYPNDYDKNTKGKKEKVRIFDTAGLGVASYPGLGSPNGDCGGDGVGPGGETKQPGKNCQAMGSK
jgi:hypothetical protein